MRQITIKWLTGILSAILMLRLPVLAAGHGKIELIERIARTSSIKISSAGAEWQYHELLGAAELLDLLPEEYKIMKPITLIKAKVPAAAKMKLYQIAFSKRRITMLSPAPGKEQFRRILFRALTRFLDRERGISESWQWRKLSRWTGWDILGNSAQNKNPRGFALPEGAKSPAADFITAAEMFFLPPAGADAGQYLKCRLPGKYRFFREYFRSRPDPQGCIHCKETFRDWIDPEEIEQIELLIASPSYVSIASIAGHMLLLIRRRGDIAGLSTVIGFVADSIDDEGAGDHGFAYVYRGIFGLYKSKIQEETLSSVIARYTMMENRDLYRLKLNFNRRQLSRFIERLWELKHTFNYRYYFFNLNCTTMMVNLINDVLPEDEQIKDRDFMDLPLNIGSKVFCSGAAEFVYPEYWSMSRQARYSSRRNREIAGQIVAYLGREFGSGAAREMKRCFDRTLSAGEENRADYYKKMPALYLALHEQLRPGNNGTRPGNVKLALNKTKLNKNFCGGISHKTRCEIRMNALRSPSFWGSFFKKRPLVAEGNQEFYHCGKRLLRYLVNAKDREIYLQSQRVNKNLEKNAAGQSIYQPPEIPTLVGLIFKLRYFLESHCPGEANALHREIRQEKSRQTMKRRRTASYNCDYSQILVSPRILRMSGSPSYFAPTVTFAAFFQEMGSGSVFSLGEDTHLELLSLGLRAGTTLSRRETGGEDGGMFRESDFKLFQFEKVMTHRHVDYHGWLNPGVGITMYDRVAREQEGVKRDVNYFNLRFILNIFEHDRFKHYLNVSLGTGFSYRDDLEDRRERFLDFLFRLNGKFYLFGKQRNALLYDISYRPRFNFASGSIAEWRVRLETRWGVGRYAAGLVSLGVMLERDRFYSVLKDLPDRERLIFYTTVRFKGPSIGKWIDFKKICNRVF